MEHYRAKAIATDMISVLKEHCDKIEIAGEIAQKKTSIERIEIVAVPKFYDVGLFNTGIASVLDNYFPIKGILPDFCVVRKLEADIPLSFYSCDHYNFGYILAWANSSETYRKQLHDRWVSKGYSSNKNRHLTIDGKAVMIPDEYSFFTRIGLAYIEPEMR